MIVSYESDFYCCFQEDLARNDFADDVSGAKHKIDLHNEMKKKIMKAPVEDIDLLGKTT